ncbi:hypothetical protein SpCBS45565_g08073 [Spizellomyces sp. 'palustris']|nr:hypothetical protein SpCBS45565_g08073 [Spizellomyces sp. 'palustris']
MYHPLKPSPADDEALIRYEHKKEIRKKNLDAYISRPALLQNLDGSIKKNTSFVRKLRVSLTHEQLPSLSKELLSLKLEKYLSEIVSALSEAKFKSSADVWAAVEISSLLHQRFADFSSQLVPMIVKQLGPPPPLYGMAPDQREKEESARIAKQRSMLRFLVELYLVGVAKDSPTQKDGLISVILKDMLSSDKEQHVNLSLAVAFVKHYGDQFLGVLPKKSRNRSDSVATGPATTGDENEALSSTESVATNQRQSFVPKEVQEAVRAILLEYYATLERHLIRDHKHIRKVEKNNHEHYITRGEISEDRQERYEKGMKTYEKLLSGTQTLAEFLEQEMPDLPEDEGMTRIGIGITGNAPDKEDKETHSAWEDDDAKAFYENLIDLKHHVPAIFLGEKKEKAEDTVEEGSKDLEGAPDEVADQSREDVRPADTKDDEKDDALHMEESPSDETGEDEVDILGADEDEDEKNQNVSSTAQAALETLLNRLPNALNRDTIDQLAIELAFLNSKSTRKKLIKTLLAVPRQRLDLLPYYSRLIATLNPYMPDIGAGIVDALERSFHGHQKRKEQVFIEEKIKNIRFIGELTKFKVTPLHIVFHCIKVLLDDFRHHNVELLCTLLETCGRFLYKSPETSTRTSNYLDILMRKKNVKNVDNRQALMIENAFYQCNPPDRPPVVAKARPPLELYIRKLIFSDLTKKTVDKISKQLRKLNWEDSNVRQMITRIFCKIWKIKFSHLHMVAYIACELTRHHPEFGVAVVDSTLEEVRIGLEQNIFTHNQRRIAVVKYLGELYNYRMVESPVIFDTLFLIVSFGHENNLPRHGVGIPLDAQHDFFRVRLCCTLLDTCGQCFDRGSYAKRLDAFLAYLQMYIQTKPPASMDVEFMISDTFEQLRPNLKLVQSYEEAVAEVNYLAAEQMQAEQNGIGGDVPGGEDSEEDDDEDEDDDYEAVRRNNATGEDDDDHVEDKEDEDDDEEEGEMYEDTVVVHVQHELDEEADDDFEQQFSRMMQESMDTRRNDRKSTFDAPVPVRMKPSNATESQEEAGNGQVAFTLLTKKGNKQQVKTMALPADSSFVISTRSKQEAEQEEKQHLKQLVLNYEERERENAKRVIEENSIWNGRPHTVIMSSSAHRGGLYRGSGGRGRGFVSNRGTAGGYEGTGGGRGGYGRPAKVTGGK